MHRLAAAAPATLTLLAAVWMTGCGSPGPERLHAGWQHGFNVTAYTPEGYARPVADQALRDLRAAGTDSVAIVPTWYMEHADSSSVEPDPQRTPSDAGVLHALQTASGLGLRVVLKPHVDVRDGSFRGEIRPRSVDAWFAAYDAMIGHYAQLAAQGRAETFVVGTELTSMARHGDRFRKIIADARARFPGRLTFAANWVQGAEQVSFWDALDTIGIDAYMPIAEGSDQDPAVGVLRQGWRPYVRRVQTLHRRYGKPVLFTELGYQARLGTALHPAGVNGPPNVDAQTRAYQATLATWASVPWLSGIYWWDRRVDGVDESQYSPIDRPAGQLLARVNGGGAVR
jgi:hypothetical protein